ncbi:C-type lectin domain family 14 member A-like [Hemibagrus wyckioides]|uniref:C-type lectin domain family 14 member A-like n=1 Tax=Hemibagrus wyckioides TaxID=337641 RepID=UPI00266B8E91|nr:C-type lectin domain family 14 member A-like [Hemibagrus wyckioides]
MDYQIGLCFVNVLIAAFSIPVSTRFYSVDLDSHSFDDAQELCARDGSLTNMLTEEETENILKVIENKRYTNFTSFWIGLQKDRAQCVQKNLPLRGFYWTVDNSAKSDLMMNKWIEDPTGTCTTALCGLLSVEYSDSKIVKWGLKSTGCTKKFPFICKHEGLSENIACSSKPNIMGTHETSEKNNDPYTLWVSCTDEFTLTCSKNTREWKLVGGTKTDIQGLCLGCKTGYKKDKDGNCVDIDECKQLKNCSFNCFNTEGSYSCMCTDEMDNFHNEDSEICKKQKQAKTSISMSPTNATKKVQDEPTPSSMDKTSPTSSPSDVHSTIGSHLHIEDSSGNFIIPLIIALLIFVVLVVIIVAIVKYCLMRSARKRAKERAAAMKESVALSGTDSMENVNE